MPRIPAEIRRKQLVHAAKSVIASHGVEGATTRRIAAAAGASLATLHYCFHTKEDLFWAIWEQQLSEMKALPEEAGGAPCDLCEVVPRHLREVMDYVVEDEEFAVATAELMLWTRRQDPPLGMKAYQIHLDAIVKYFRKFVGPGDDPELVEPLAQMFASAVDGLMFQWIAYRDRAGLDQAIDLWGDAVRLLVASRRRQDPGGEQP